MHLEGLSLCEGRLLGKRTIDSGTDLLDSGPCFALPEVLVGCPNTCRIGGWRSSTIGSSPVSGSFIFREYTLVDGMATEKTILLNQAGVLSLVGLPEI